MDNIILDSHLVGEVVKMYREKSGLSQEVVSGFAGIGRTHLSAIESGMRKPTLETFFRVCHAMNAKPSEVLQSIENKIDMK